LTNRLSPRFARHMPRAVSWLLRLSFGGTSPGSLSRQRPLAPDP
jgi:hypothetical protein